MQIVSLSSGDIPSGGKTTLKFKINNPNLPGTDATVTVVVSADGMTCGGSCNFDETVEPGTTSQTFTATLTAGTVAAGDTKDLKIQISATIDGVGGGTGGASRDVTVRGPDKPQTVRQVSGRVKDQDGKVVAGAAVALQDSQSHRYSTTSNGDGGYSFTSSDNEPIAVGSLLVGANKNGYEITSVNAQGGAGKSVTVPLTIKLKVAATSAAPSPSTSISTTPTEEVTDDATDPATDDETAAAADKTPTSGKDEGSGSTLYLVLGGLLVAAGIGAIVLVLMRRKSGEDPEDPDGAGAPSGGVPPSKGGQFGADETRLAAPVGGRVNDATMIAPRSGAPSMADAPTMIHQAPPVAPVDEFPDPYGAPVPQGGGYNAPGGWGTAGAPAAAGAAAGTYGAAQGANGYGPPNQYGAPVPAQGGGYPEQDDNGYAANGYDGYDANQGGYGEPEGYDQAAAGYADQGAYGVPQQAEQRYDEPTGMYRPEPNGGYPQETGYGDQDGYGAPEPAYGQNGAYAQGGQDYAAQAQGGGYQGGNYGAPAEPAEQAGYDAWGGQGDGIDSGNAYGPPAGGNNYGGGGTYGGAQAGGTYGGAPAPAGNYGAPAPAGNYGAPVPAGNYGAPAPAGNYGAPAPAGNYGAPAGGGYGGEPANGYGGDQGGYDPRAVYGQPAGGPGQQQPPHPQQGGYPDQGGYGAEQQGGYYGGAEQQQQGGGRHGGQPPRQQPPEPAQRRPLDWLDD